MAVASAFFGLLLLTVSQQLLNPNLYKQSLETSGIYYQIDSQIQARLLSQLDKEQQDSSAFVLLRPIIRSIEFDDIAKEIAEENIERALSFIDSRSESLEFYFPKERLQSNYNSAEIAKGFLEAIEREFVMLEACTVTQENIILEDFSNREQLLIPSCLPSDQKLREDILNAIEKKAVTTLDNENLLATILDESGLGDLNENTPIALLIRDESQLAQIKDALDLTRAIFSFRVIIPLLLILASVFFTIIALTQKNLNLRIIIRTLSLISFFSALLLTLTALIPRLIVEDIVSRVISEHQTLSVLATQFVKGLLEPPLYVGIALLLFTILLRIALLFINANIKSDK